MVDKITTNPQRSEPVVNKEGLLTDQAIEWNDDIELIINETVGGDSITFPQYRLGKLPPPFQNIGGIAFGEETGALFLKPVFVATPFDTTTFRINNVVEAAGVAQFNYTTGPLTALVVGEEVIIFGYTDPSRQIYNGTFQITIGVEDDFFRIASIPFAGSESNRDFMVGSAWRNVIDNGIVF